MLINLQSVFDKCSMRAVCAFNVYNMETILAVLSAAKKHNTYVVVAFGERYFRCAPIEVIADMVKGACEHLEIDAVLHLDHARELSSVIKAIRCGFTSVMYDGSDLSFKENMKNTKKVVDLARTVEVSVEGELGYIAREYECVNFGYTSPEEAQEFAMYTGVSALAVAIGNAHGLYNGIPVLDFERLRDIKKVVDVPLVLHGCSGIPADAIKEAILIGVRKININTELSLAAVSAVRDIIARNVVPGLRFEEIAALAGEKMRKVAESYIQLLDSF